MKLSRTEFTQRSAKLLETTSKLTRSKRSEIESGTIMKTTEEAMSTKLSRRGFLGVSGVALGGLTLGGAVAGTGTGKAPTAQKCEDNGCDYPVDPKSTQRYSYPDKLRKFTPDMQPDLADDEMRITFLGTTGGPPIRKAQAQMSIFVEVGPCGSTSPRAATPSSARTSCGRPT